MLEIKNMTKSFGDLEILREVNLSVNKGDVDVILGQSGSGKTTLLRCIDYLEKPDAGEIEIGDVRADYRQIRKKDVLQIRRKMGFVFQNYGLFQNKTALENVMLGLEVVRKIPKKEAGERAKEAIEKVGLWERKDHYPSQLSGGQQQRIGIARAFAAKPDIILMDEPTSSLDPGLVGEVLKTVENLAKEGITMLIVTHELSFARNVASNIFFMDHGILAEKTEAGEFFTHPKTQNALEFLRKASNDYSYTI